MNRSPPSGFALCFFVGVPHEQRTAFSGGISYASARTRSGRDTPMTSVGGGGCRTPRWTRRGSPALLRVWRSPRGEPTPSSGSQKGLHRRVVPAGRDHEALQHDQWFERARPVEGISGHAGERGAGRHRDSTRGPGRHHSRRPESDGGRRDKGSPTGNVQAVGEQLETGAAWVANTAAGVALTAL